MMVSIVRGWFEKPFQFSAKFWYFFTCVHWDPYLQLPLTLPDRVRELTEDITSEAATPYEKVKWIEAYLQANFEYTNRPDLSLGSSADFVDRFLFEIQSGYCDYFSTSMAIMVRTLGLPARWVKGYTGGSLEDEDLLIPGFTENASQLGNQTYIVRNSDAHSWVEVYFEGWGWLPFEPTSGFLLPTVFAEEQVPAPGLDPLTNLTDTAGNEAMNDSWLSPLKFVLAGFILLLGLSIMLLGIRLHWWRGLWALLTQHREYNMNQQALQEVNGIIRMFRRKGYIRHLHETMRESFARWNEQNDRLKKDLDQLLRIMEIAKYSPYRITSDDLMLIIKMKRRLKEEL